MEIMPLFPAMVCIENQQEKVLMKSLVKRMVPDVPVSTVMEVPCTPVDGSTAPSAVSVASITVSVTDPPSTDIEVPTLATAPSTGAVPLPVAAALPDAKANETVIVQPKPTRPVRRGRPATPGLPSSTEEDVEANAEAKGKIECGSLRRRLSSLVTGFLQIAKKVRDDQLAKEWEIVLCCIVQSQDSGLEVLAAHTPNDKSKVHALRETLKELKITSPSQLTCEAKNAVWSHIEQLI
jgi:hypothetical protein